MVDGALKTHEPKGVFPGGFHPIRYFGMVKAVSARCSVNAEGESANDPL